MNNIQVNSISLPNIKIINNIPNSCKEFEKIYLDCMKINNPSHTKCKIAFEQWYECFKILNN